MPRQATAPDVAGNPRGPAGAGSLTSAPRFSGSRRAAVGYGRGRMAKDIKAHITGTVWKIEVKVGDKVDEGTTVVILESMKMEIPVESEDDGTVKEIRCEEGQAVSEGDVLVVLE